MREDMSCTEENGQTMFPKRLAYSEDASTKYSERARHFAERENRMLTNYAIRFFKLNTAQIQETREFEENVTA